MQKLSQFELRNVNANEGVRLGPIAPIGTLPSFLNAYQGGQTFSSEMTDENSNFQNLLSNFQGELTQKQDEDMQDLLMMELSNVNPQAMFDCDLKMVKDLPTMTDEGFESSNADSNDSFQQSEEKIFGQQELFGSVEIEKKGYQVRTPEKKRKQLSFEDIDECSERLFWAPRKKNQRHQRNDSNRQN